MLHQRRFAPRRALIAAEAVLGTLRDRVKVSDPGLIRLMLALRGTLSVFLTASAAMLIAHFAGWPLPEFASGVTLSMMAPFLMRDPTLRQRQLTLLGLALPAAAATIATALLHGHGMAGDSCFLVLVFLCFLLHPLSPRAIGLGLVAVVTTYVGLYLELPPATLPTQLLSLVIAVPIIAFACFVAVPLDPATTLRRLVVAVQGRAAQLLRSARGLMENGSAQSVDLSALRRDLTDLNEAALAADDQLAVLDPSGGAAVRSGLIRVELTTARLIAALQQETAGPRHGTRLLLHERRMRRGGRYTMTPDHAEPGSLRASLVELGHAVHALGEAARTLGPAQRPPGAVLLPPGPLAWRLAARVTLAAGLAMAGGIMLSPQRWFWAVMTVYVVFLNARSRGDTIYKGAQRLAGTLLGIASGVVLTALLAGHAALQVAALLLSIFGLFYLFLASYTAGIFCVTLMLGLLYGMLGVPTEQLLFLRFEETAIGALAAILVAVFVFPARTRDQVVRSGRNVLASLVEAVRASRCAMIGLADTAPLEAMRRVDRQVADLRLALVPLTAGRRLLRRSALERPIPALLECVHWTRVLAAASHECPQPQYTGPLVALAAEIEARLARLAGNPSSEPLALEPAISPVETAGCSLDAGDAEIRAALDNLSAAVGILAERLQAGTFAGFAVDGQPDLARS